MPNVIRRARSNDGHVFNIEALPRVRDSLLIAVLGQPEPIKRAAPKTFHGPKAYTKRGVTGRHCSDEQVLAVRRLSGWHGMLPVEIAEATGLPVCYVRTLLTWTTRTHLDPGPAPAATAEVANG